MIDESVSKWWTSFKVNCGLLSTAADCLLPPCLSLFQRSISSHLLLSSFIASPPSIGPSLLPSCECCQSRRHVSLSSSLLSLRSRFSVPTMNHIYLSLCQFSRLIFLRPFRHAPWLLNYYEAKWQKICTEFVLMEWMYREMCQSHARINRGNSPWQCNGIVHWWRLVLRYVTPRLHIVSLFLCRNVHINLRSMPLDEINKMTLFYRQLMENKITTIERGAFQDLKELERL